MKSEDKTLISDRIDKEIKETQEKVEKYKKLSKPISPENAIGRISRMDAINNKSVVEAALRESEHKLDNLIFVKSQIESKEFGLCRSIMEESWIRNSFANFCRTLCVCTFSQ